MAAAAVWSGFANCGPGNASCCGNDPIVSNLGPVVGGLILANVMRIGDSGVILKCCKPLIAV